MSRFNFLPCLLIGLTVEMFIVELQCTQEDTNHHWCHDRTRWKAKQRETLNKHNTATLSVPFDSRLNVHITWADFSLFTFSVWFDIWDSHCKLQWLLYVSSLDHLWYPEQQSEEVQRKPFDTHLLPKVNSAYFCCHSSPVLSLLSSFSFHGLAIKILTANWKAHYSIWITIDAMSDKVKN